MTLTLQPSRGGHPLTFRTEAAHGSCDPFGSGRPAPPWRHFSPDAPIRITFRTLDDPHADGGASAGAIMLRTLRPQVITGIEVDGHTVKQGWWDGA